MMFGFRAGADFQLSGDVSPKVGYSISPFFQYDYARLADHLALGVRAEFTFDRFQKLVTAQVAADGVEQSYRTTRSLTYFDFALLATATLRLGRLHPWAAAGMGLALGNFDSPEAAYSPGDFRTTSPLVVGAGGLDVAVGRGALVGLHVEYRGILAKPRSVLAGGQTINVFGDRLSVQAGLLYQF
jgi:opacity protein-like surface antigen